MSAPRPGPASQVCAVAPTGSGLTAQSRLPDVDVVVGDGRGAMAAAVFAAAETGCDWLWLVGPGAVVEPTALEALLAAAADAQALGNPVLFAAKPVDGAGRLDATAAPVLRILAREQAIAGARHRLVALRAASYGSLLVHRRAVERHGPPRVDFAGAGDDLEWTGRILRDDPGYMVPGSVVRRPAGVVRDQRALARNRVRMLRGEGLAGPERLWSAFVLTQDLLGAVAARPATAPGLLRAVGAGARAGG